MMQPTLKEASNNNQSYEENCNLTQNSPKCNFIHKQVYNPKDHHVETGPLGFDWMKTVLYAKLKKGKY